MHRRTFTILLLSFFLLNCAKIQLRPDSFSAYTVPNWTMFGGDSTRSNVYPGNISLPLKLKWRHNTTAAVGKTITVLNGILFFNTMDGLIYALNIKTGKKIGKIKTAIHSTSVILDSMLFIARRYGDDTLFAYNLNQARFEWQVNAGDISSEPLILNSGIVITALYKHIDLYDFLQGERIWQTELDEQLHSSPACENETIVFGCDDDQVYAVNKTDGKIQWKFKTGANVLATPAIKNGVVYIGSSDKMFYALDIHSGTLKWKFSAGGQILQAAAVNDSVVIFGSTDSHLYCLNRISGELLWQFEAKSVVSTSPLICGDKVFFGSLDHHYYALNLTGGEQLWKYKTKGRVRTSPVIWGNYLIGASEDNFVYLFTTTEEK